MKGFWIGEAIAWSADSALYGGSHAPPQEDLAMSIAAISANAFFQNAHQSPLSGPHRVKDQFTLPDQTPIPGNARAGETQNAGPAQPGAWRGDPLFNVLAGSSNRLQGDPLFNVLRQGDAE
jgi:hypothetical protein